MGTDEFEEDAGDVVAAAAGLEVDLRIAAACRGSGNPAALAWLAEGLRLRPGDLVVDLGGGLGGPAAWIERHYGCTVVAAEPAEGPALGARALFGLSTVRSSAARQPIRGGAAVAALVLGVLSVIDDPVAALVEAGRIAGRIGILEWCSTEATEVRAGGSCFPTPGELERAVRDAGLAVRQSVPLHVDAPEAWDAAADQASTGSSDAEAAVGRAIADGRLRVHLTLAGRGR